MRIFMLAALLAPGLFSQTWINTPGQTIQIEALQTTPPDQAPPARIPKMWKLGTPKALATTVPPSTCAIPLINVGPARSFNGDPKIALPQSAPGVDPKITIKVMPVCPKR